jgi:cytochrome P450
MNSAENHLQYEFTSAIYYVYFHPLSRLPGPKLYAVSHIPHTWAQITGRKPFMIHQLHEKYGNIVRYSPQQVSLCDDASYKEVLTNKPGRGQLMKDPLVYSSLSGKAHSILTTPSDEEHSRFRRLLAHGFSEKAVREQEPVLLHYADLLIHRLHEHSKDGPQDMVTWYNWTTFDLIGDLTFNESFDCLEKSTYHPWIEFVFGNVKAAHIMAGLGAFPQLSFLLMLLFKKRIASKKEQNASFTRKKVAHRLASQTDRVDFLGYVLRHKGTETEMSQDEIEATSGILVLGGRTLAR